MELNVKNCLGPSHESIPVAYDMQKQWFDEHVYTVDDADFGYTPPNYEGPVTIYKEDTPDEAEWIMRRISQLEELMDLRKPIGNEWYFDIATGNCPCGMSNDEWERLTTQRDEYDAMGQHFGRNE